MTLDATKTPINLENLEFVRLKIPRLIPSDLIENIKAADFTPEQFYKYHESQIDNPYNQLYALIDEVKKIHGFLWAKQNAINNTLFINNFSISKEFWGKGKGMNLAIHFVGKLKKQLKAPKVLWTTSNEKFFLKHGFKRNKNVLMEYQDNDNITIKP